MTCSYHDYLSQHQSKNIMHLYDLDNFSNTLHAMNTHYPTDFHFTFSYRKPTSFES